jgi:hypothetical protein
MARTSRIFAGFLVAALAGVVLAAPTFAATASVSFSGSSPLGLPLLSCGSTPSTASLSLTTGDTLNVQNKTGQNATLYINGGKTTHDVGNNESVPIVFPAGAWTVAVVPNCVLNLNNGGAVDVNVAQPAQTVAPAPTPAHTSAPTGRTHPTTRPTHTPTNTATVDPRSGHSSTPSATPKVTTVGASGGHPTGATTATGSTLAVVAGQQIDIGAAAALPASESAPAAPSYLLAVIALIGILGVGSAVIRALNNRRRARRGAY